MGIEALLAVGRHVLLVVFGEFGAIDDVAVIGIARLDAVAFLAALDEELVGIHAELALYLPFLVALHAALLQDGLDDVRVGDLLLKRLRLDVLVFLKRRQADELADRIGCIFREVILTVGDRCPVVAGVGHDADACENHEPVEGLGGAGCQRPCPDDESEHCGACEDGASPEMVLHKFAALESPALVKKEAEYHRENGSHGSKESREDGGPVFAAGKHRKDFLECDQHENPDRHVQDHRVEIPEEADDVGHFLAIGLACQERHGDQSANGQQSRECQEIGAAFLCRAFVEVDFVAHFLQV